MIRNYHAIFIKFRGPVHLGQSGIILEETDHILRSDTFWSALVWGAYYYGGGNSVKELIDAFNQRRIRISSGFPFYTNGNTSLLFFPKPILPIPKIVGEELEDIKRLKKAKILPQNLFEKIINGARLLNNDINYLKTSMEKLSDLVKAFSRPRVLLDRVSASSMLYHVKGLSFRCDDEVCSGLYFLLDYQSKNDYKLLRDSLAILQDHGLGGERTYGWGLFTMDEKDVSIKIPDSPNAYISISLIAPTREDWVKIKNYQDCYYNLITRGGWTFDPRTKKAFRRKAVIMLEEGSVFSTQIEGRLVDVTPSKTSSYTIYRNGIPFLIPALIR